MSKTTDSKLVATALLHSPVFRQMPAATRTHLEKSARIERFDMQTLLSAAHEPATFLRYVVEGHIDLVSRSANGVEMTVGTMDRGAWATWLSCFDAHPPVQDFYAAAGSRFIAFPVAAMREAATQHPAVYPAIISEIGTRFRAILEWTEQAAILDREQRIGKLLLILSRQAASRVGPSTVHATQDRIAGLARCSRQTANETLKALEGRGLIHQRYKRIEIPDSAALALFVDA